MKKFLKEKHEGAATFEPMFIFIAALIVLILGIIFAFWYANVHA